MQVYGPLPIKYISDWYIKMLHFLFSSNLDCFEIIYQGYRPKDSFELHEKYSTPIQYLK